MDIASHIDHTLLKATATRQEIARLCEEARQFRFAAVCVPPVYVKMAHELLAGSGVATATVIGFPFGYSTTISKLAEVQQAVLDGADELDMVICLAALKSGDWDALKEEISLITDYLHGQKKVLKLIIESGILTEQEIIRCCQLYRQYEVQYLKTSTGYAAQGASVEAVRLMRANLPAHIRIKASGGIRTFDFAQKLLAAGADRLGCSSSVKIMAEANGAERTMDLHTS
jgi:deoxyribose-phosphate aldolase